MDDEEKLPDSYKLRFEFYKHLTTLCFAAGLFVATILEKQQGMIDPLKGRGAIAAFFLGAMGAFSHMFILSHTIPRDSYGGVFDGLLKVADVGTSLGSIVMFVCGCMLVIGS